MKYNSKLIQKRKGHIHKSMYIKKELENENFCFPADYCEPNEEIKIY
jgi:hypothetical protein